MDAFVPACGDGPRAKRPASATIACRFAHPALAVTNKPDLEFADQRVSLFELGPCKAGGDLVPRRRCLAEPGTAPGLVRYGRQTQADVGLKIVSLSNASA